MQSVLGVEILRYALCSACPELIEGCAMRGGIDLENASASALPVAFRSEVEIPLQRAAGVASELQ